MNDKKFEQYQIIRDHIVAIMEQYNFTEAEVLHALQMLRKDVPEQLTEALEFHD